MGRSTLNEVLGCGVGLAAALTLSACVGTRTGNPYEKAPEYTTSSRFADPLPTTPGNDGGGGLAGGPFANPYESYGRDLVATFERYVAMAVSGRGVLTVDVADPKAPVVAGELPIAGTIYQLAATDGGVTVAVLERTTIDVTELPDAPLPREVQRLVHVDLSDPSQPRRAFEVDLEGTFFGFEVRGADTIVIEALAASSSESWCYVGSGGLLGGEGWSPATMRVTRFTRSASGFQAQEAVELASDVGGALAAGPDTFLVVDDYQTDQPSVRWVELSGGSLTEGQPFVVDGKPRAADREGDVLALVLEHRDSSHTLDLYTLVAGAAQRRGRLTLPGRTSTTAVDLLASGVAIIDGEGAPASLVDVANLDAPRVASQLPIDVQRLVETEAGLIGFGTSGGPDGSGTLVVSLWDASDATSAVQLSRVQTDWFYPRSDPGNESWTIDAERGLLLVPFERPEGVQPAREGQVNTAHRLGVFALTGGELTLESDQLSRSVLARPWTDGRSAFGLGYEGFEVLPLSPSEGLDAPVSALLPLRTELLRPIDELDVAGTHVALRERAEDGVFYLEVDGRAGGEPELLELPHRGDALVPLGERVVVLGMRGVASECEYFEQQGVDPREIVDIVGSDEAFDACGPLRARGVSVVALDGEPRIVESLPFTGAMGVEPLDEVFVRAELDGYVPLDDGRLILLAQRMRQCNSYESCEVLGVPAYESQATPGGSCSPNGECTSNPSVINFVNGYENVLVVYVLDGVATASPVLTASAELEGRFELFDEGPLDVRRKLLSSEGTLAFTREEPIYNDEGNSETDAYGDSLKQYFLDRVVLHDDGSVETLPAVNTPGLPIALRDEDVFCLEPRRVEGDAQQSGQDGQGEGDQTPIGVVLHRAGLHGAGAFIESSVELGTGFAAAMVHGEAVYSLRAVGDPCEAGTPVELSAVELALGGELERSAGLELPTVFWRFASPASTDADTLLLLGGPHPDARLELDVGEPGRPRVVRYSTVVAP